MTPVKKTTTRKPTKAQIQQKEIKAERDFLFRRLIVSTSVHQSGDEIGRSSTAMIIAAFDSGIPIYENQYPLDPADLRRCENTYYAAPDHLRERMLPIIQAYRRFVAKRYPEVGCGESNA